MSRALFLLACILMLGPATATSAEMTSVFLEELTWIELRDAIGAGKTTAIVPIGGTEQNGPAMAIGKHNVRVKVLAGKIASTLGDAIVAPVMAYVPEGEVDPPTAHMRFPGTLTIPDAVFENVLEWTAKSLRHSGFRTIVFIGDHGGYQKDLAAVAEKLNRQWVKSDARVFDIADYYRVTQTDYVQALKDHGARDNEIGTHAALADTSLMLAVDPRLVRADRLAALAGRDEASGVYGGSPERSSPELGQLGVDLIVLRTVAAIRKAAARQ